MNIKEVESRTGLTRANIRFYESKGLLCPKRGANNYREYTEKDVERLRKTVLLRRIGLSVEDIRKVFDGELTLQRAVKQVREELQTQLKQLEGSLALCDTMCEREESIKFLPVEEYEQQIKELEQDGKWFRDMVENTIQRKANRIFLSGFLGERYGIPDRYLVVLDMLIIFSVYMIGVLVLEILMTGTLEFEPYSFAQGTIYVMIFSVVAALFIQMVRFMWNLAEKHFPKGKEKQRWIVRGLATVLTTVLVIYIFRHYVIFLIALLLYGAMGG